MAQDFLEELKWRGILFDQSNGLEKAIARGPMAGYIGFDPTAPSLTIGNYVQIMVLKLFQQSGHKPIVLMGGATGRIGDPSGKDKERQLKSFDELDKNLQAQSDQFRKLLRFDDSDSGAMMLNNYDFYTGINILDFLRDVGKHLTVNYMMSKESVKKRIETGISFTEFSYQILQAYDFLHLFENHNCTLQMGGSDQWGNITSGTELIRRNHGSEKAFALTSHLLTKADGQKFGKSEAGNIWLDPSLTSPYKFYQFWLRADDRDMEKFLKTFSLKSREEIEANINLLESDPNAAKKDLSIELTTRIHSKEDCESAIKVSELMFNRKLQSDSLKQMSPSQLEMVAQEIPSASVEKSQIIEGCKLVDLMTDVTGFSSSKSEIRRAVKGNAISLNKEKVSDADFDVNINSLLHNRFLLIENGKKNKFIIEVS